MDFPRPISRSANADHITIITPPEYAALDAGARAKLAAGVDIPGAPHGSGVARKDIGDTPNFQMSIDMNGGIGKAIEARDEAAGGGGDD